MRGIAGLPVAYAGVRRWPRGQGETVLVIPGFATGDRATLALRLFLKRLGYQVHGWGLGMNDGRVEHWTAQVADRIAALATRGPIKLVGWSLGGVLAREAARHAPDQVEHIVTMGTPVVGGPKYTLVADHYRQRGVDLDRIERQVAETNERPLPMRITAIYSRLDSVVAWRACLDDNPRNDVRYVELNVGHAEFGFSGAVFRAVSEALAEPNGPRDRHKP